MPYQIRVSAEREVAQSDLAHSIKVITALMPKEGGLLYINTSESNRGRNRNILFTALSNYGIHCF